MSLTMGDLASVVSDVLTFLDAQNIESLEGISNRCGKSYAIKDSTGTIFVDERGGYLGLILLTLAYDLPDFGTVLDIEFNPSYGSTRIYVLAPSLLSHCGPVGAMQEAGLPQMTTIGNCDLASIRKWLSSVGGHRAPSSGPHRAHPSR